MRNVLLLLVSLMIFASFASAEVSIAITEPQNNASFAVNSTVLVKLDVQTTEGEAIKDVRIYNHGKSKTRLRRAPWEYEWKNMQSGSYELEAKVTLDNDDNTEIWTEAPVYIRCGGVEKGERVFNGSFESGKLSPWTSTFHESASATFNLYDDYYFDDAHYLFIEIENGSTENWHIQLSQAVELDSGHVYDIYFYADADDKKEIQVTMQQNQDPWTQHFAQNMEIDGADEYSASFEATSNDPTNNLRFNIGNNKISLFLDNIRLVDHNASSVKEKYLGFHGAPIEYELFKAYPNPFNMSTTIQYKLSTEADVRLEIFNMNGQLVNTLAQGIQAAGHYALHWDGTDTQNNVVPSGVYFYQLTYTTSGMTSALHQKMMLVK